MRDVDDEVARLATELAGIAARDEMPEAVTNELRRIGSPAARAALADTLRSSPSGRARFFAAVALGELRAQEHLDAFVAALRDPAQAAWHSGILLWMTELDCTEQVPLLCEHLAKGEFASMHYAVHALQAMMRGERLPPLGDLRAGWTILAAVKSDDDFQMEGVAIARDVLRYLRARVRAGRGRAGT